MEPIHSVHCIGISCVLHTYNKLNIFERLHNFLKLQKFVGFSSSKEIERIEKFSFFFSKTIFQLLLSEKYLIITYLITRIGYYLSITIDSFNKLT